MARTSVPWRVSARAARFPGRAGGVAVHGDLPGLCRRADVLSGRLAGTRTGRSGAVLRVPSVAVPGAGAGAGDAAVGGGTPQRHAGTAADAADPALAGGAGQVPGGVDLHRRRAGADLPD